jgi:hypothetical protein
VGQRGAQTRLWRKGIGLTLGSFPPLDHRVAAFDGASDGLAEVAQHGPSIRDSIASGAPCPWTCSFGINARPLAGNDLDAGISLSQLVRASALQSGKRSIGASRTRSTRIGP